MAAVGVGFLFLFTVVPLWLNQDLLKKLCDESVPYVCVMLCTR